MSSDPMQTQQHAASAAAPAPAAAASSSSAASSSAAAASSRPAGSGSGGGSSMEEEGEFLAADEVEQVIEAAGGEAAEAAADEDMAAAGAEDDEEEELTPEEEKQRAEDLAKAGKMATELRQMLDADDSVQGFFDSKDSVYCVALSPLHPTWALTGDGDDQAFVWDLTSGERKFALAGHTDSVIGAGFSADGKLLATASMDATVRVWSAADGRCLRTLEGPAKELEWMEWHPVGSVLAAGGADETVWMWNADTGECMHVFSGQGGAVICGAWTADGKALITGGESGDLIVWNPKSGDASIHLKNLHDGPITSFATHPDKAQKLCMTGGADGVVKIVNFETGRVLTTFKGAHADSVESVQFAPKLKLAASCSVDGKVKVWDLTNGQCRLTCSAHEDAVTHIEWAPAAGAGAAGGEPFLFSSSVDNTVRLWDVRSGECVRTWKGHSAPVLDFRVSADGATVVTGSDDHTSLVFRR